VRALALAALGALGSLAAQDPLPPGKQDPIKNWQYRRTEIDPVTGQEEVTASIEGREAVPLDLTRRREVFEVRGVSGSYWTEAQPARQRPAERIDFKAERARLDNAARILRLEDSVRLVRPRDGAVLAAPRAIVRFGSAWVCPSCPAREAAAGPCPRGHGPLREKTAVRLEAPESFDYASPAGALRGRGLLADDALSDVVVERDALIELIGDPASLQTPSAPKTGTPAVAQIASRGRLTLAADPEDPGRRKVTARDGVRIDRQDAEGSLTADAKEAEILIRTPEGKGTPTLDRVTARGEVRVSGTGAHGRILKAEGDTALLERTEAGGVAGERVRLEGRPARASMGGHAVEAPTLVLRNPEGVGTFEGGVSARIAGLREGSPPVSLRSRTLTVAARPGGAEVEEIDARGEVVLDGLLAGDGRPGGRATAERFVWRPLEERGRLESARHVRIEQGGSLVCAPEVFLQDGGRAVLLRGPKLVRLTQERDGRVEEFRISAEGDVLYDAASGRIRLRDRCTIRSPEFRLEADRVDVVLSPDGKDVRSLDAAGSIRGVRTAEGLTIRGDRLAYDPARRELRISGVPWALAGAGRASTLQRELLFSERPDGKGGILRTTELRGGGDRVRIVIPEGAK
jgi:hypothetical protein